MADLFENFGKRTYPQISCPNEVSGISDVVKGTEFHVTLEDCLLCKTDSFITSFQVLFASFYLFNLAYPKCLNAMLTFVQKDIVKLHDSSQNITKVIGLITKIRKCML